MNVGFDFSLEKYTKDGLRIFIPGMSGSGKSYAAKVLSEELHKIGYPLLIIDPEGEYASFREKYSTIVIGGSYGDVPLTPTIIDNTVSTVLISEKPLIAIFDLSLLLQTDRNKYAAMVQEKLFISASKNRRPVIFVVEECQLIAPQVPPKGLDRTSLDMAIDLAKRGRKRGINSIWISGFYTG